ncbi:C-terminal helicase domain-containing protein [Aspergillus fijiensis CBS 313.89]|uniref:DNA2/NAM7 helicase-like C-terminal domain-containing protein n=1 Tax=Aspergillus fijiensis CBS 313.89 TaxID=1448319 RepID=A0A8G1RLJ3_9EURO|nr:uncharacterized protein BO72DRAFT_498883 [Aspergillus fijiensis CBS 313.89]RAK74667.1 hypothetical protein BO72DRAFT_498883 [Aspergillus fijiensis CBS 313.89]
MYRGQNVRAVPNVASDVAPNVSPAVPDVAPDVAPPDTVNVAPIGPDIAPDAVGPSVYVTENQDIGFLDIDAQAQRDASSLWFSLTEARLAVDLAMTLSARRINVLILTPYNAQVAKIKADLANRYHNATRKPRILTVDSSQGTEAECVIVSLSRNVNTPGFLKSKRRFNVMTSRASQSVFYLGKWSYIQSATLQQSSPTLFGMLDHYPAHVPRFVIDPS